MKKLTKISWLTQGWPSSEFPTSGIFHVAQANELQKYGLDLSVFAPIPWVPEFLSRFRPHWTSYQKIPSTTQTDAFRVNWVRYLTTPRENHIFLAHKTLFSSLKPLLDREKPDLIHAHFAYSGGMVASMYKTNTNTPYVLTLHGDDVTIYPHRSKRALKLFRHTLQNANQVLAVSNQLAHLAQNLIDVDIKIIPNGIDVDQFLCPLSKTEARRALNIGINKFVPIFAGRLTIEKGIPTLVSALQNLPVQNMQPIFIGDGPLRNFIQEALPNAYCAGVLPQKELAQWMRAADIFILPSQHEGLGQVLLEAGINHLPVIGSKTGGIIELLSDGRGFLFDVDDKNQILEILASFLNNNLAFKQSSNKLYEYVIKNFEISYCTQKLLDVYRDVLP